MTRLHLRFSLRFTLVALVISACLSLSARSSVAADDLEKQLMIAAADVLKHAKDSGYQNVGVLKFRVKNGNDSTGGFDSALARRLADKLEFALILKSDYDSPIGIAKQASKHAATIPEASHVSIAGRRKLFTGRYPMAWGRQTKSLDAFYTGVAILSADLSKMTIGIMVADANVSTLTLVKKMEVRPDVDDLVDAGESFTVRGIFDRAEVELTQSERKDKATEEAILTSLNKNSESVDSTTGPSTLASPHSDASEGNDKSTSGKSTSSSTKQSSTKHPLSPANLDAAIRFEVRYDGKPQTIEFIGGQAFVQEPKEGQEIQFVIKRPEAAYSGQQHPRLAVVVKVNGENTASRQTLPDAKCVPWVFQSDMDLFGISGFKIDNDKTEPFRVLSDAESKDKEIDYGEHAGTITVTVFPELKNPPKPDSITNSGEDFALLDDASHPATPPSTLAALKLRLNKVATRGLIGSSNAIHLKGETTKFKSDSVPMMSATLRYYNASDLPK